MCLGCGPANAHGHHLQARLAGGQVVARHVFDVRHSGAPGIVHGGAVATVVDDLLGFVLHLVGEPAVTRQLQVDYLAPIRLDAPLELVADLVRRDGRKLFLEARGTDVASGRPLLTARALFVVVPLEHFA